MIEYIVRRGQKYDTVLKIDRIHSDVLVNKKQVCNMVSSEATNFFSWQKKKKYQTVFRVDAIVNILREKNKL